MAEPSTIAVTISVEDLAPVPSLSAGVQRNQEVEQVSRPDGPTIEFAVSIDLVETPDGVDFRGPYVHGPRGERFLYICWGSTDAAGEFHRSARTKLMLHDVDAGLARAGPRLHATVSATDERGRLRTGRVRHPAITWATDPRL